MATYNNTMRRMRQFTDAMRKLDATRRDEIGKIDRVKFSPQYIEQEESRINGKAQSKRVQLVNEAKTDLIADLASMRKNITDRLTKAPTTDQVNLLAAIRGIDDLTISELRMYADSFRDCPVLIRQLAQIGAAHHYQMNAPTADQLLSTVDRLEDAYATYLSGYTGDASGIASPVIREMEQFFMLDNGNITETEYKTLDEADRAFWDRHVASPVFHETPDLLDPTDQNAAPAVQFFFANVADLRAYLDEHKKNLPNAARDKFEQNVLDNAPEHYGSALRYFRATGEELPLNSIGDLETE